MNELLHTIDPTIEYALGWTIIHSFWQASLIALIMSLVHRYDRNQNATFKYGASVVSMVSVFLISAITFGLYYSTSSAPEELTETIAFSQFQISNNSENSFLSSLNLFFANNLIHINAMWALGVILFLMRFIFSFAYTKYLRKTATFSNSVVLNQSFKKVRENYFVDKVITIAESTKIDVPLVIGHMKPLILFPVGIVNMLNPAEVEAIITHEFAHIKRFDYLTNILLTLVEILFYFHPAVWWISANVKAERENCCDDFALSKHIDKMVYAKALVKLEEIKSYRSPALAMPFTSKKHQLINRIKRIMNMPQTQNDIKEKSIATILLLSIVLLFSNQANSETSQSESFSETVETLEKDQIIGNEALILKVENGKFKSLKVDNELLENDVTDKIASVFENNINNKNSYTVTIKESPLLELNGDILQFKGEGGVIFESDDKSHFPRLLADTIPNKYNRNSVTIKTEDDGKSVEIKKENGKVTMLKIDGKVIPQSEYNKYQKELDSNEFIYELDEDENIFKHFNDSVFSNSFGMLFDGENWREFGGNMNQLFDEKMLKRFEDMKGMRFDFKHFEDMDHLRGLEKLHELRGPVEMEGFENLNEMFEEMGIKIDSTFNGIKFKFDKMDGLNNFHFFDNFDSDDQNIFKHEGSGYKQSTVVDKIGSMLNKDGLLKEYKSNKVELSGKHLKINGEKMPKALFEKYKSIYQESTGAPLTKGSKMIFDVEGKPSKRKVKTF